MLQVRVVAAALAALISTTVSAQTAPKPAPATPETASKPSQFDQVDTDHDGFISRAEFMAADKKRFEEFDTNHDGKIDAKEIASSPPLMERNLRTAERMMKQWDANGDGVVTAEEFKAAGEQRFSKQDKDGTGKIARRMPPPGAKPLLKAPQPQPQPAPAKKD